MATLKSTTIDSGAGTDATHSEDGVDRNSASDLTYNIRNSGAGAIKVQQDGVDVALTGKRGVPIMAAGMKPATTSGCSALNWQETTTNKVMLGYLEFADGVTSYAHFSIPMPKGWNASTFTAKFNWYSPSATGNAEWGIQALALSDGDTLDAAWGTEQVVTDAVGTANTLRTSAETPAITAAGTPAKGDTLYCRVYRKGGHANDTVAGVIRLLSVELLPSFDGQNDA